MNHLYQQRQRRSLVFVVSLLLHSLILIALLAQLQRNAQRTLPADQNELTELERAALKARMSNFGADVSFVDEPPQEQQQVTQQESPDTQKIMGEKIPATSLEQIAQIIQEAAPPQPPSRTQEQPAPQAKQPEQKITLADLAHGFLATLSQDKTAQDDMTRSGNPNIRPRLQELKYLSYIRQLHWYLQSAFARNTTPLYLDRGVQSVCLLSMTIDKAGKLLNVQQQQSTGNKQLDNHLAMLIESAAPFPPLPDHFEAAQWRYDLGIQVRCHEGQNQLRLYMR